MDHVFYIGIKPIHVGRVMPIFFILDSRVVGFSPRRWVQGDAGAKIPCPYLSF